MAHQQIHAVWEHARKFQRSLNWVRFKAEQILWAIDRGKEAPSLAALRAIHAEVVKLPPANPAPMRWLILVMVPNRPQSKRLLRRMMAALPHSDFFVYHFDAASVDDANYRSWTHEKWFRSSAQ
eukprot:2182892-Prymnesium_polylepis.2